MSESTFGAPDEVKDADRLGHAAHMLPDRCAWMVFSLAAVFATGCDTKDDEASAGTGSESGWEGSECDEGADCGPVAECVASDEAVGLDHTLADGRSLEEVLDVTLREHVIAVDWRDAERSLGALTLTRVAGDPQLVTYAPTGEANADWCDAPHVQLVVAGVVSTDDGMLDEMWTGTASVGDDGVLQLSHGFVTAAMGGTYEDAEFEELSLLVGIDSSVDPPSLSGSLQGYGPTTPPGNGMPGIPGVIEWVADIGRAEI